MLKPSALVFLALFSVNVLASTNAEIVFRTDSYISSDYRSTADRSFGFMGAHFSNWQGLDASQQQNVLLGEIEGVFSPQAPALSYLNIPQMFIGSKGFYFGRMLESWSSLDENWGRGFFQPQFRGNPLLPKSQGLTGFFVDIGEPESDFKAQLFASFLFLPDQSVSYQVKDGQIEANSPWIAQMPKYVQFDLGGNVISQINWNIVKPEINEIIMNSSYVAAVSYGQENRGFSSSASFAYKPANQIVLGADAVVPSSSTVRVTVVPKVFFHTLASLDLRYALSSTAFGLGVVREKPEAPGFSSELTYAIYEESLSVSPYAKINLFKGVEAMISYLDVTGGTSKFVGPKVDQIGQVLPKRFEYRNALKVALNYLVFQKRGSGLMLRGGYTQGTIDDFGLIDFSADYQVNRQWKIAASGNLVRASNSVDAPLFRDFGSNDSLSLGATYVF
jgi:hypothetical protein